MKVYFCKLYSKKLLNKMNNTYTIKYNFSEIKLERRQ